MEQRKIIPLSRLKKSKTPDADTVALRHEELGKKKNRELLEMCSREWENLHTMREERERNLRFSYGDQWGDLVSYKGRTMTEREYIMEEGNVPLSNRLVRRIVTAVVGARLKAKSEPMCIARDPDRQREGEMMSMTLQCNWQTTKMAEILTPQFEDFLHGGIAVSRETYEYRNELLDSWTDIVNPNYVFFSSRMKDPRHDDITMIGEIHDVSFNELCTKFGHSREEYQKLKEFYLAQNYRYQTDITVDLNDKNKTTTLNFYTPNDSSLCRVFEIWTQEMRPRYRCHDWLSGELYKIDEEDYESIRQENLARIKMGKENGLLLEDTPLIEVEHFFDTYWYYQFLTPDGDILAEGETPYAHKSHPYSIKLFPFVNGEVHPYIGDVIDQQKYINRLTTLDYFVTRSTAKGVLMVPANAIPDDMSPEDFAEQWENADGVVIYSPKPGTPIPQQIANRSTNIGISDMINLQLRMMEDVSGVHGAAQGKDPNSGTSARLYAQQTENANTMILPVIQSFDDFVLRVAGKKAKTIQQYYDEPRMISISGKQYSGIKTYDPEKARDLEYTMSIIESSATPVNRMLINNDLKEFWARGAISLEMLLQCGEFPYSEALLQSLRAAKEQAEAQGAPQSLPPEVLQQVAAQGTGNTDAAMQMLRGA